MRASPRVTAAIITRMLEKIKGFLNWKPGSKARVIASELGLDRSSVSRALHAHSDKFQQDDSFGWRVLSDAVRIEFSGAGWLVSKNFEDALAKGFYKKPDDADVVLVLKDNCKPMLEFIARLLALCNQLHSNWKTVTLDLESSPKTLTYLDRIGFFQVLNASVVVLPNRPSGRLAKTFRGNNDGVIELRLIDPNDPDESIPALLRNSFVNCAGQSYSHAAFTVLSELFGNVTEHSFSPTAGFAGLQFYPKSRKIQAVISDNGLGIVGTLSPVVPMKYPQVAAKMSASEHPEVTLLQEVFQRQGLSQVDEEGRGLGIWRSGDLAEKFRATISVRQERFELRVEHGHNGVRFRHRVDLAPLYGTHICFEFKLDD